MKRRIPWLFGGVLLVSGLFAAEEKEIAVTDSISTGPPPGTEATPAMAYAPVGPRAGEEFDAAGAIGDRPGALLFIHELTRNGLPVIRGIDQIGAEYALLGFKSHTFLLSDDRTASETKLKAVNGSLKLRSPIVLSLDGMDGPGNYALNRKAVLSLVMLKEGKVHRSVAFTDVNAADTQQVRKLIEEVAGPFPKDPEAIRELAASQLPDDPEALRRLAIDQSIELHRLRAQNTQLKEQATGYTMQRGASGNPRMQRRGAPEEKSQGSPLKEKKPDDQPAKREGKSPEDAELNALLRAFIRQDADKESIDAIFGDIEKRAGQSDSLHREAIDMFKLMLSFRDRYGIPEAQALAESFLQEHDRTAPADSRQTKP